MNVHDIVNKIPSSLFFDSLPDRQQTLKYITYLYNNIPQSKTVNQDELFRAVIAHELRIINMKLTEPEILIMIGLNKINLEDFTIPSQLLIQKIIDQNTDKYDLDTLYRVMSQIMSKIPKDLKDKVTGKHKLQIFQLLAQYIKMDTNLLEKFIAFDPSLNTPITMELNTSDYKTLNDQYLRDLYKYQQKQPYITAENMEYGEIAAKLAQTTLSTHPQNLDTSQNAQYIDANPDLMLGNDKKLYFFDSSSGTLSEMPPFNNNNQSQVSANDLKTILSANKVNQNDIQSLIDSLNPTTTTTPVTTVTNGYIASLENMFKGLQTGTTQAQAVITTQAQLPDNSPIPPAFLTKLYELKKGHETLFNEQELNDVNNEYISLWNSTDNRSNNQQLNSNVTRPTYLDGKQMSNNAVELNKKVKMLEQTYEISHFNNMNNNIVDDVVIDKIKNTNKDVENIAIGFVTIIILILLLVIFNTIRNKK